ncbi:hypothetical protein [Corallococcus exiguus]|uniref:hypothetical protein n=1 Tax=Corallococcus exiguus TaxID=83462 RepID=UPI0020B8EE3B|nr:hypothetical protein [Corallococcus exiguus]
MSVQGWRLDAYAANPVVLYMHDDGSGGLFGAGRTDILPIGKGRAYVQGDALLVDIEFDQDDEFARRVESKVEKGILNAVSGNRPANDVSASLKASLGRARRAPRVPMG